MSLAPQVVRDGHVGKSVATALHKFSLGSFKDPTLASRKSDKRLRAEASASAGLPGGAEEAGTGVSQDVLRGPACREKEPLFSARHWT